MEINVTRLPLVQCFVTDFPTAGNGTLCSPTSGMCFSCPLTSSYLSSDNAQGRDTCYTLWALVLVIGIVGVVTNCLTVIILLGKSPPCGPSLASLLIPLSIFDMIASGFALSYVTLTLVILENQSRSWLTMQLYHISLVTYLLGRTGSLFMAILIGVERYLVVAHPFKMKIWLSVRKTRVVAGLTCCLAILSNIPRYLSVTLVENEKAHDVPPLRGFPYLFQSSSVGLLIFREMVWLGRVHFLVDFMLPLPILLLLNLLLFAKITQTNLQRRLLNPSQRSEVSSAKTFAMVVTVLLVCHIFPISFYIFLSFFRHIYRELSFATTLSICLHASLNFVIYFAHVKRFRHAFAELLSQAWLIIRSNKNFLCWRTKIITHDKQDDQSGDTNTSDNLPRFLKDDANI